MAFDQRSTEILQFVVTSIHPRSTDIEAKFNLTRQQVNYSIKSINQFLSGNGFEPITRNKRGDLIISPLVIKHFSSSIVHETHSYFINEDERSSLIFLIMVGSLDYLSLNHISQQLNISKNTALKDINLLKAKIEPFDICIEYDRINGYRMVGDENGIRALIIECIYSITQMSNGNQILMDIFQNDKTTIDQIERNIYRIEQYLKIEMTDDSIKNLKYILSFFFLRIEAKHYVTMSLNETHIIGTLEYEAVLKIFPTIKQAPEDEQIYITLQMLTSSRNYRSVSTCPHHLDITEIIDQVIDNLELMCSINFLDRMPLKNSLIQHCIPAIYRIQYGFHVTNPLYEHITTKYQYLHECARSICAPIERYINKKIPEMELSLFTVLFGGWLKQNNKLDALKKYRAIVVCTNGISISNLIFFTLRELLPEIEFVSYCSVRDLGNIKFDYDIIFSTITLQTSKIFYLIKISLDTMYKQNLRKSVLWSLLGIHDTSIKIADILSIFKEFGEIKDHASLEQSLYNFIYPKAPRTLEHDHVKSIGELIQPNYIQVINQTLDWRDAIAVAAMPLLSDNKISQRYIDKMIENIEMNQPYIQINRDVIIAHSSVDDGVFDVAFSILKLPEVIDVFGYTSAKVIIVLATPDFNQHLKGLSQLNIILENPVVFDVIYNATSAKQIYDNICTYNFDENIDLGI